MLNENQTEANINYEDESQRGAALAIVIIIVAILAVIGATALAFSSSEARIAGSDLQRTQTFYAAVAGIEKMTNAFSDLFREKINPTREDLDKIELAHPPELVTEGFTFNQTLTEDTKRLNELRTIQGLGTDIVIYMPPNRNWSFDTTYLTPNKLPPGTPFFQYVQATAFRQKLR